MDRGGGDRNNRDRIRAATVTDAEALADFGRRTFVGTYLPLAPEFEPIMRAHVTEAFDVAVVRRELASERVSFFVLERSGRLAGYAKLEESAPPDEVSARSARPLRLERLYVNGTETGAGLGSSLLSHCEEWARSAAFDGVWLGVWEINPRAARFYARHDYDQIGHVVWEFGEYRDLDLLMFKKL